MHNPQGRTWADGPWFISSSHALHQHCTARSGACWSRTKRVRCVNRTAKELVDLHRTSAPGLLYPMQSCIAKAPSTVEAPRFEWRDTNTRYDRHREESEMTLPCTSSPDLSLQKGFLLRTRSRSCASSPAIFLLQKGILARQRSRAIVKAPSTSSPLSCRRAR